MKLSEKSNSSLEEGTSFEIPTMFPLDVEAQSDNAVDKKGNDEGNCKESSIVNSKPGWNFSNGYGLLGWLNKWRKGKDTKCRQQEACVGEAQENQSFTLFRRVIGGKTKTSENTSTREQEAKAYPSQGKTTKPKSKRIFIYGIRSPLNYMHIQR